MKERLLQPALHHRFVHLPLQRPAPAFIEVAAAAAEVLGRQIQQGVGGPAVPALDGLLFTALARWQQGQIGDSAQVQ